MRRTVRAALLTLALSAPALADGIILPGKAIVAPARTPDQRALIAFDGTTETLVVETTVQGEGRDFAWILPLPAAPRIEASTAGLFPTLEAACAADVVEHDRSGATGVALVLVALGVGFWTSIRWWRRPLPPRVAVWVTPVLVLATATYVVVNMGCGGRHDTMKAEGVGAPPVVTVLARQQVGAFDTATLEARDPAALRAWLDANGFRAPAGADAVVADYVREGWVFVASRIRRDAEDDAVRRVHPLAFTFPAKSAVYPMRLTGVGNESVALELFVAGDRRAEADGLAVEHCERLRIDHEDVHTELKRRIAGAAVLTKLTGTLDRAAMTRDVAVGWTDFDEVRRSFVTPAVALQRALPPGAIALAVVLLLGAIAGRRRPGTAPFTPFDAASWAGAIVVAAVVVGIAWTTAPRLPDGARVASERDGNLSKLRAPPDSVRGDAAALCAWAEDATRGIDNEWTGESVHEEDSPGDWTVREIDGRVELVLFDGVDERAIDCSRRVAVQGVVRAADGSSVAGARVTFHATGIASYVPNLQRPDTKTEPDGRFRVDVPQGRTWDVAVVHDDHPDLTGTTIDLHRGAVPPLDLVLPPERALRGRVHDADGRPLAGATIAASQESPRDMRRQRLATTGADGSFEFRGFDARRDEIEVSLHVHAATNCDGKPAWTVVLKPDSAPFELRLPK